MKAKGLAIVLLICSFPVLADRFNVKGYGATGDGLTDDSASIKAAANALANAGGGELYFPKGTYKVFSTLTENLANFSNLIGVALTCDGCTVAIDAARVFNAYESYTMWNFTGCQNIKIDGFNVTGPPMDISQTAFRGVEFVRLNHSNVNVAMPNNKLQAVLAGVIISNNNGSGAYDGNPRTRNVHIGNLEVKQAWYGYNSQFAADNVQIDHLRTDTIHRSFFIYGARNNRVTVNSKDPWGDDCLITTGAGPSINGNEDIQLKYISGRDTTNSSGASSKIKIVFVAPTIGETRPATQRNISLDVNITYAGAGNANTGLAAITIDKTDASGNPDNTARGHKLENLTITGYIENYPQFAGFGIINTSPNNTFVAGDYWSNIQLRNLKIVNSVYARLALASLVDQITLENVASTQTVELVQSQTDLRPPQAGRYKLISCSFPNLYELSGAASPLEYIRGGSSGSMFLPVGWRDHVVSDAGAGGDIVWTLPPATVGMEFSFARSSAYIIDLAPRVGDSIRGCTGGTTKLRLAAPGAGCKLRVNSSGIWEVVYAQGGTGCV